MTKVWLNTEKHGKKRRKRVGEFSFSKVPLTFARGQGVPPCGIQERKVYSCSSDLRLRHVNDAQRVAPRPLCLAARSRVLTLRFRDLRPCLVAYRLSPRALLGALGAENLSEKDCYLIYLFHFLPVLRVLHLIKVFISSLFC